MKRPYEHPICETFHVEHTRLLEVSIRHQDGDHPITVDSYDATAAHFDASSASSFKYTFTCNTDVTQQHDLMYASTGSIANSGLSVAPLSFRHALTAVRFCVGQNLSYGATIKSITLHGVKTTGTYTLPTAANADGSWSNLGNPTDITLDGVSLTTDDNPGSIINGEAYTFLLILQDLSDVTAEIHMNAPQKSTGTLKGYSLKASLSTSSAWQQGTTRTYTLSNNSTSNWEYVLTAAPSGGNIAYNGTSGSYVIRSYRQSHDDSKKQPVAWEVTGYEYSDDDGVTWTSGQPAWLTTLSLTNGEGGAAQQTGTATVTTSYTDLSAARNASLSGATAKSNYDLSQDGETANCYVISAPGTYKIPLIYGNMRGSDGTLNTACLGNTSDLRNTFTEGAGRSLYTQATQPSFILPLIEDVSGSTGADVVWSDAGSGIVTNLAVDYTNHFLTFEVPQAACPTPPPSATPTPSTVTTPVETTTTGTTAPQKCVVSRRNHL